MFCNDCAQMKGVYFQLRLEIGGWGDGGGGMGVRDQRTCRHHKVGPPGTSLWTILECTVWSYSEREN